MQVPCKVLVVDDEVGMTRLLKLNLEESGEFDVRVENSGRDGLAAAREFRPDVILLDVIMPDMRGTEVLGQLRADPTLERTPVIFLTAVLPQVPDAGAEPSMADCIGIAKPARAADVIAVIRRVLD
jgi:two-component system OmpR family response regulator